MVGVVSVLSALGDNFVLRKVAEELRFVRSREGWISNTLVV